jgi:hypothetical protein
MNGGVRPEDRRPREDEMQLQATDSIPAQLLGFAAERVSNQRCHSVPRLPRKLLRAQFGGRRASGSTRR